MTTNLITTIFCDVGGVILTNGWDRHSRAKAASQFGFDLDEFNSRHQLCFYLYEIGKITLKEYLETTLFYEERPFTLQQFINFMYAQSEPIEEMVTYIKELKSNYNLKVVLLSNEGRELTEHRVKTCGLSEIADFFVVSSFVHLRKPDVAIYQMAIDLVQVPPKNIVYLDDRQLFVEIALNMGIHGIRHLDVATTRAAIDELICNQR